MSDEKDEQLTSKGVEAFWQWFTESCEGFGERFENRVLLEELDARVRALGDFAWELGPGISQPASFVISPGDNRHLLLHSQAFVARAPKIPGWEIHASKPPKLWNMTFSMLDEDGNPVAVDASGWSCVLHEYPEGDRELLIEAANVASLSAAKQRIAAEIAVDGVIGEAARITSFDVVGVVVSLEPELKRKAKPLRELAPSP